MKQIILGETEERFTKKLRKEIACCCLAGILVMGLNILLCFLRTDENHSALLMINIVTDVIYGCTLISYVEERISTKKTMIKLWKRSHRKFIATVEEISGEQHRIPGMECLEILAGERRLYLPQTGTIRLEEGITYAFGIVDNVVVEAEKWEI